MTRWLMRTALLSGLVTWNVFLPAAAPTTTAQDAPPRPPQTFRGGTDVVLVDVYPHRDGRIVEGLTATDFELLEDGKSQKIDSFEFVRLEADAGAAPRRDPNTIPDMRAIAANPHNRVFVAYLDNGHTTVEGGNFIRRPLVGMLERTVGNDDLFGVMTPGMRPRDLTLARRTESIDEQLGRYWTWGTRARLTPDNADPMELQLRECFHDRNMIEALGFEPWQVPDGPVVRYLDEILVERRREDRTLASLEALVQYLGSLREARSVVIAVTDGWILFEPDRTLTSQPPRDRRFSRTIPQPGAREAPRTGPGDVSFAECVNELNRLAPLDGARRLRDLIALANRNNVSVYPVASAGLQVSDDPGIRGPESPSPGSLPTAPGLRDASRMADRVTSLRTVAEATDAFAVVATNDLSGGLRRVSDDVSAYYLLTYASTNPNPDGRYRKIDVRVKGAGLTVRARRGYVAARPEDNAGREAPAAPVIAAGVTDALGALTAVRPTAEMFVHGAVAGSSIRVAVELAGQSASRWPAGTTATASIAAPGSGPPVSVTAPVDSAWRNALIAIPTPASAGPWNVTVTVGRGLDRLQEQVVVAAPGAGPLGEALVSRGRPGARAVLRPAARMTFSRTERVHVEWPLLAPIDRRDVRLLDSRGQVLNAPIAIADVTTPTTAVAADLNLGPLANGDYVMEISAHAGGTTVVRYVAFRVGQ